MSDPADSSNQEHEYQDLPVRWFHAVDVPAWDPLKKHTPKKPTRTNTKVENHQQEEVGECPMEWIPFSKRDSSALEAAFKLKVVGKKVSCNEDYLFEVDLDSREISPIYWIGPVYQVVRATWFYQAYGKFIPCDENLSEQIEEGYIKHKAWIPPPDPNNEDSQSKNQKIERSWYLTEKYGGQYVIYINAVMAWLFLDDITGSVAKTLFSMITRGENRGGIRLVRGYPEVENYLSKKPPSPVKKPETNISSDANGNDGSASKNDDDIEKIKMSNQQKEETEDYADSEGPEREIDHLIFCIHGIGQKLSERSGYPSFVHEVNLLRRTLKNTYATNPPPEAASRMGDRKINSNYGRRKFTKGSQIGNGVQVLPIHWRQDIKFGMASEDNKTRHQLMSSLSEEGQPTLDEITLDGVPNLRMLISDALVDVLLYMTPKFRDMILLNVTREMNRVYNLFVDRNPKFIKNGGKISIYGHSLGSVLAFDVLCQQPLSNSSLNNLNVHGGRSRDDSYDTYISHRRGSHSRYASGEFYNPSDAGLGNSSGGPNTRNGGSGIGRSNDRIDKHRSSGGITTSQQNLIFDEPEQASFSLDTERNHYGHRSANRNRRSEDLKLQLKAQQQSRYKLDFEVEDLYSVGSPIGLFLLLKGTKIGSRKFYHVINEISESKNWEEVSLDNHEDNEVSYNVDGKIHGRKGSRAELEQLEQRSILNDEADLIPLCYPAVKNIYNIFHRTDPIAYRLEPLVSRHYGASMKPALVPYHKGGLKAVQLGIQEFSSNISRKTTTIFNTIIAALSFKRVESKSDSQSERQKKIVRQNLLRQEQIKRLQNHSQSEPNLLDNALLDITDLSGEFSNASSVDIKNSRNEHLGQVHLHHAHSSPNILIRSENSTNDSRRNSIDDAVDSEEGSVYASEMYRDVNGSVIGLTAEARRKFYQTHMSSSPVLLEDGKLDYSIVGEEKLRRLNKSGRIDYCLQQGILDVSYISAITVHLNYWTDCDAAYFILQESYKTYD